MAEQSLCAKLGIRLAIVGTSASLAFAAPITNAGSQDTTAHTASNRTGFYFDQTAAAERAAVVVGGIGGISFDVVSGVPIITNNQNAVALPAPQAGGQTLIHLGGTDAVASTRIMIEGFDSNPSYNGRRWGGTNAVPTAVATGKILWAASGFGYDGSAATVLLASIQMTTAEAQTTIAHGTSMFFLVTPIGATANVTQFTLSGTAATFASTAPVTISSTVATTSSTTGALIVSGGGGFAGAIQSAANINAGTRFNSLGTVTTAAANGQASFWRSGGTIGTAGDMVFQADAGVANAAFVFRTGQTTPVTVLTVSGVSGGTFTVDDASTATVTTMLTLNHTSTGTVANNFGTRVLFNLEDDGGTNQNAGTLGFFWPTAASATRTSRFRIETVNSAAALATVLTVDSTSITYTPSDAATTTATAVMLINHATSGTPAAGFGSSIQTQGHDDGNTIRLMSLLSTTWTDAASATRTSKFTINIAVNAVSTAIASWTNALFSTVCTDAATATATVGLSLNHATSGTAANGFGTTIQVQGHDDGGTQRVMSQIVTTWTTAASATRASKIAFTVQVAAVNTTGFTLASTSATFAAGFPVTISDTTASTSTSTGALIVSGGIGANGKITGTSFTCTNDIVSNTGRLYSGASLTTASVTGFVAMWRSGGTIGTAGDMVFQSDLAANAAFVFRAGITTPATICTLSPGLPAGTTPGIAVAGTSVITGGVTDGYTASARYTPTYSGAFTVTRHNYLDLNNVTLASSAVLTDAAVFRFDAAPGTHSALASNGAVVVTITGVGPTGAQTTIQGWMKINVNGTLRYMPFW